MSSQPTELLPCTEEDELATSNELLLCSSLEDEISTELELLLLPSEFELSIFVPELLLGSL
jgi:hypothetical protein